MTETCRSGWEDIMRRFSILGVSLIDYTAREGLRLAEGYRRSGALNTATYLTTQTLELASRDDRVKELVEDTDMTLCVEPDILEAAGIANAGRVREIEDRDFLKEFLKRLARQQDSIYVLGDTQEQAAEFRRMLLGQQENLNIVGCSGYDEFDLQQERLMNALNAVTPKVILSRMTWPVDLELMHEGRKFLNAELWLALPERKLPGKSKQTVADRIRRKIFQKKVNEYNQEKAAQ